MVKITSKQILFGLIVIALVLRSFRLEYLTTFQGDQGRDLIHIREILVARKLTLLGHPASIGLYNGPLYYYLVAPFLLLFHFDPLGGAVASLIFNLLAMIILYKLGIKFFSPAFAVIVCYLFTISPMMVEFGRTMLPPYFSPPFFFLWILGSLAYLQNSEVKYGWLVGLSLGTLIQLHYLFGLLLLPTVVTAFIRRDRVRLFPFMARVILGTILMMAPFIAFELRHNFLNTKLFIAFMQKPHFASFSLSITLIFMSKTFGYLFGFPSALFGGIVFFPLLLLSIFKRRASKLSWYFWLVFLIALACVLILRVPVDYPAYHYLMIPVLTLLLIMASVIAQLDRRWQIICLAAITLCSFLSYDMLRDNGFTMVSKWNLHTLREVAKIVESDDGILQPFEVVSMVDGDTQAYHLRYLLIKDGIYPLDIADYSSAQVLYIVTRDEPRQVFNYSLYEVNSIRPLIIKKSWQHPSGINLVRVDRTI